LFEYFTFKSNKFLIVNIYNVKLILLDLIRSRFYLERWSRTIFKKSKLQKRTR